MAEYKIAVIRGDGIGIEVMEEGLKVLNAIADSMTSNGTSWSFLGFRLLSSARAHDARRCLGYSGNV